MAKQLPFTNRIRELREAKRLTQQDIANAIGMTRQTIVAIEKGKYSPSLEAAFRIAHTLDAALEEVFIWSGETV
ncbi:MAG: transcriptional regulator [Hirschia sp.]|nr:transcriptional regulator [Hirschia sp.]MBF17877.1 transcriptional regulator [Hirschia sp.]|tara:strand:- start:1639 stop:1860 length:222 start_codon:yes stop_codon:yes gene_type:complete